MSQVMYCKMVVVCKRCKTPQIIQNLKKSKFCCKKCGFRMKVAVIPFEARTVRSNRSVPKTVKNEGSIEEFEQFDVNYQLLKEQYVALELKHQKLIETYDQVCDKVCQLDSELKKVLNTQATEKASNELENLRKLCDFQNDQIILLRKDYSDLESTVEFFKAENERCNQLKIRDVIDTFLEYMSGIYNASLDIKDPVALSGMIRARTDKVMLTARGLGLYISRSERESDLGSGRLDIDTKITADIQLDGKVNKCRKFGCKFKDNFTPEIPEKVCVWKYFPPKSENVSVVAESVPDVACPAKNVVQTTCLPPIATDKQNDQNDT